MTQPTATRRQVRTAAIGAVALTLIGAALRFWRLGAWSFDSDETFTLRDSVLLRVDNPRPLLYFLNHYLVGPILPLDEFGLRLLPALFGVLGIPALYFVGRRLIGSRAALFAALLLTFSPLHVYYSQFARYWSLVFFLSAIYPYALYIGIRDRSRNALLLGSAAGAIATLAHPTSVLLLGSVALWFVLQYGRGENVRQMWRLPVVRRGLLATLVLAVVIGLRFVPMLESWIASHRGDDNTEFLLHLPGRPGLKQLAFVASYVESVTLPLALISLLGLYLLWLRRERSLALFFGCVLVFPAAFLILLSFVAPISTFYLVPPIPAFFFGAGIFLDRLAALDWELRPRWLAAATIALIVIMAGAPTLVSQYRDGRRYDYRNVARWLDGRRGPGDVVVSDQPKALGYYLPGLEAEYLRGDPAPLVQALSRLRAGSHSHSHGKALWVISPAPAHAFRSNPRLGSLMGWIYTNCQLRNTVGVGRVDFRQYHLQVFRCAA